MVYAQPELPGCPNSSRVTRKTPKQTCRFDGICYKHYFPLHSSPHHYRRLENPDRRIRDWKPTRESSTRIHRERCERKQVYVFVSLAGYWECAPASIDAGKLLNSPLFARVVCFKLLGFFEINYSLLLFYLQSSSCLEHLFFYQTRSIRSRRNPSPVSRILFTFVSRNTREWVVFWSNHGYLFVGRLVHTRISVNPQTRLTRKTMA